MTKIVILMFFCFNIYGQGNKKLSSVQNFEQSKTYFEKKQYKKALFYINESLAFNQLNRDYLMLKTKILFSDSNCLDGFNTITKLIVNENGQQDDEAITYFSELLDCLGETDKSTKILNDYVKKYKSSEILARLAQRYFILKDYDKSVHFYKELIKLNPKDVAAIIDLSGIYSFLNKKDEVRELTLQGLKDNENCIPLLNNLASYYFMEKEFESAIQIENQIIKIQTNVENLASRAMFYEYNKQFSEAYEDYKRIILLDKCNAFHYSKILQYEYNNRMYEKVIENSYKVINCNASYENSIIDGLYTSLFFTGDFKKGNLYLDKKLALNPDNFNPYYIKSLLLLQDKQYDKGLVYLDLALKSADVNKIDILNVNIAKLGYYLLKEDYQGFVNYLNSGDVKTLNNNLNFTFIEDDKSKITEIKTDFNKNTGVINSSILIPTKVFRLLERKYGLKLTISK
ncbi:tetratricopeptide repeat protein [Flavobacterium sp. JLP]|uniref:tetratricopeptide repeat protein n=1 Tax=Flavobacterium sp. JLP TaxID=2783793 RepID=UPI00188C3CDE|nr:tetratricopeptide repeat protein [Flavobacterium sp. JLP]MBF4508834.1 tetratricopeptide repeat protein [Flavobacterium sp. JLP]